MTAQFRRPDDLPLITGVLAGTQGHLQELADFRVEEIPAYLPCGDGAHTYAFIEKAGLTTTDAIRRICAALGADPKDAGYAGMKDKRGITQQWISLGDTDPARVKALQLEQIRIIHVRRHGNKLRTGHLHGNRFRIVLREVVDDAANHAKTIAACLTARGLPNYYGVQRFGMRGDNADFALRALRGECRLPRDKRQRRLICSSLQSQLFNEVLSKRIEQDLLSSVMNGDVLQPAGRSSVFVSEDQDNDQRRLERGEVRITGPICGPKMVRPRSASDARRWEDAIFESYGLTPQTFSAWGRNALGSRRPSTVPVEQFSVEAIAEHTLQLQFTLPVGSYASVLLREIAKRPVVGAQR